ncbi:MAG: ABC transporter permease [Solirubrobacteraceae bacterium]
MTDALRAEWTKLRTIVGTWWLIVGAAALTVAASAGIAASTHVSPGGPGGVSQDPTKLSLIGVDLGQAVVAVLAVMAITDEYGTGMIRMTLAASPRRAITLGAKAVNIAGLALVIGVPAVAGCLFAGHLLLPDAGLDPAHGYALISIANGPTLRAAVGSVVYLGLIALLSLGIGTIFRDTAVSTGIVLGLLYLPPLLAQLLSGPWRRDIQQFAPMSAGLAIQATRNISTLPISPWAGLGVLAGWAAGLLLVGLAALKVRDA